MADISSLLSTTNGTGMPPADMIGSRSESMSRADFLQMLTAELKAQDPLNPMNGQEFASQLATFSSLQELQKISSSMDLQQQTSLLTAKSFNNSMAAGLIGKIARAEDNQVTLGTTGSGNLHYTLGEAATDITIEIKDSSGKVVRTINPTKQASGEQTVEWDGLNGDGQRAAADSYTFSVKAKNIDGQDVAVSQYIEGTISEIRYVEGNVVLVMNGREIQLSQVLSIREGDPGQKG
jgi:flagellar basal-body rod modification protein FlgD